MRRTTLIAVPVLLAVLTGGAPAGAGGLEPRAGDAPGRMVEGEAVVRVGPARLRQVQQRLNATGYDAGPVDGIWGDRTARALRNFQEAQGLEPTGTLTLATLTRLGL